MGRVLIIDDDYDTCEVLQFMISHIGHSAEYCHTLHDGVDAVKKKEFDVVFLDVQLPDGSGLDYIKTIQALENSPEVIVITGAGDPDGAEIAIKNGAWDYLQKPLSPKNIMLPVKRVLEYKENQKKSQVKTRLLKRDRIIGSSRAMQDALEHLAQAANNESNVLITGETGTGKEVFAQTLHENSNRADSHLVVVDCAALPESLIESALFGHVKGAFTGADRTVDGLVKMADKGTLFLDEIGELSLVLQKTLLRVLQEKTFRPVGAIQEQRSDFRLVSATNRNLDEMVRQNTFREDLFFRLRSQTIELPPLRERVEDIELLAAYYVKVITEKYDWRPKGISPDFLDALKAYDWSGNVRELCNIIEQAMYNAQNVPIIFAKHLPEELRIKVIDQQLKIGEESNTCLPGSLTLANEVLTAKDLPPFKEFREAAFRDLENIYLQKLVEITGGDIGESMKIAQLGRTRLYNLFKKHQISRTAG